MTISTHETYKYSHSGKKNIEKPIELTYIIIFGI